MALEHRSYSQSVQVRGPGFFIGRLLLLVVIGYAAMIIVYSSAVSILAGGAPANLPSQNIERADVFQAVATEAIRSSLSPWWKNAPWPDGVIFARLQSRLRTADPLMLHAVVGGVAFSVLGFIAGRMYLVNCALLLPACLFFATYGFLRSDLFPLSLKNPSLVAIVVAVQLVSVYGFALWGKWSSRG
ncbi:MAG: hypothetical protein J0M12_14730 [Deltaproteobacteria bacterium]|nr:hypothetical protein [Deltaproteobacteria bacterium]